MAPIPTQRPERRLHLFCGKIASGKSTLARQIVAQAPGILIAEDHWLSTLYPGQIRALDDYVAAVGRWRSAIESHLIDLLRAGLPVVLDMAANTRATRAWALRVAAAAGAPHTLHWLDIDDATCRQRLRLRNQSGEHPYSVDDAMFERFTARFEPPSNDEGLTTVVVSTPCERR